MSKDLWQHARKKIEREDQQRAWALGFDRCQKCGEWFHRGDDEWSDCVSCGRHCPACADKVDWEWCEECGLFYCQECYGAGGQFHCLVCNSDI